MIKSPYGAAGRMGQRIITHNWRKGRFAVRWASGHPRSGTRRPLAVAADGVHITDSLNAVVAACDVLIDLRKGFA
jgi:dihydrodipicolinate reductase